MIENYINITLTNNDIGSPYWAMCSFDSYSLVLNVNDLSDYEKNLFDEFYTIFNNNFSNYIKNHTFNYNFIDLVFIKPDGFSVIDTKHFDFELMDSNVKTKIIELYNLLDKYLIKD
jgi:hypothetical protein